MTSHSVKEFLETRSFYDIRELIGFSEMCKRQEIGASVINTNISLRIL